MARIHFNSGEGEGEGNHVSRPVKRMRWATTRKTGQSGVKKRLSLLQRVPKVRLSAYEEKPDGQDNHGEISKDSPMGQQQPQKEEESQGRTIYVNVPLPDDAKTEDGHLKAQYSRNKIRTSKYTPLSFVPKNLWFQFHNIANVYFLFIVILSVSWLFPYDVTSLILLDFPHLRRLQSRLGLCSLDLYSNGDCHQRCSGGLAQDGAGHRAQQFPCLQAGGLGQREFIGGRHLHVEAFQEGLHEDGDCHLPPNERHEKQETPTFREGR